MTCDLYRFYDVDNHLLYVGISLHAAARASQHRGDKVWWPQVARMDVERHPDRKTALIAEMSAIRTEHPTWNVIGNSSPAKEQPRPTRQPRCQPWACKTCWSLIDQGTERGYLQRRPSTGEWEVICRICDNDRAAIGIDVDAFRWIDLRRISNTSEVKEWTKHYLGKRWAFVPFVDAFQSSCLIDGWSEAISDGVDELAVRGWFDEQRAGRSDYSDIVRALSEDVSTTSMPPEYEKPF